jgi:hypothetical protein
MARKIWIVLRLARQDRGENVFLQTVGAYTTPEQAQAVLACKNTGYFEDIEITDTRNPYGPKLKILCYCEYGIHETLLEEVEVSESPTI